MRIASVILTTLCLALAARGHAAPVTVTGQVVDTAGQPLANAEVWLSRTTGEARRFPEVTAARADGEGRFSFAGVETEGLGYGTGAELTVLAYREPLALGCARAGHPGTRPVVVTCEAAEPVRGRVTDAAGAGVAATLSLEWAGLDSADGDYVVVRTAGDLERRLTVRAAPDGSFTVPWLPAEASACCWVAAPGFAQTIWSTDGQGAQTVVLTRAADLDLCYTCPERAAVLAGLRVAVTTSDGPLRWAVTDAGGRLHLPDLAPGRHTICAQTPLNSPWQAPGREVTLTAGQATTVEVALERAAVVTGVVLGADTNEPVPGARVWAEGENSFGMREPVVTDANGAYTLYALPGSLFYGVTEPAPEGFAGTEVAELRVTAGDTTAPPLRLARAVRAEGVVVDQAGQAVADAEVYLQYGGRGPAALTDARGRFSLPGERRPSPRQVWARQGDLCSDPLTLSPQPPAPLRLVLTPRPPVRLQVRLVYQDGKPFAGARLQVECSLGRSAGRGRSGADGTYLSRPLPALGEYTLTATAPACEGARSTTWTAVAGQTHDYGTLALTRAAGTVAGTVTGGDGKPLGGVTVFSAGDGPQPVQTTSDAAGRFHLAGFYPGQACVLATGSGYALSGVCVAVGTGEAAITLRPRPTVTALGPPLVPAARTPRERELAAAAALLRRAIALATDRGRDALVAKLAALDPAEGRRLAAQYQVPDPLIIAAVGRGLLSSDPALALKTLAALKACPDVQGVNLYLHEHVNAVRVLAEVDPPQARALFAQVLPLVQMQERELLQAVYLVVLGRAMLPLDRALAETAFTPAHRLLDGMPRDEQSSDFRAIVARLWAPYDPEAALEMVQGLHYREGDEQRPEAAIAAQFAPTDPARAEAIAEQLPQAARSDGALAVAYAMLPKDPARALRMVRALPEARARRRGLAWLAEGLRQADPAQALALYQEAVGPPEEGAAAAPSTWRGADWGELAWLGARLGYPGYEELAWRAVANRRRSGDPRLAASGFELAQLALPLALTMPDLAAALAAAAAPAAREAAEAPASWPATLLATQALAHPEQLEALADTLRPQAEAAYLEAINLLLTEPDLRPALILSRRGAWTPEAEQLLLQQMW